MALLPRRGRDRSRVTEGFLGKHNNVCRSVHRPASTVDLVRALSPRLPCQLAAGGWVYLGCAAPASRHLDALPVSRLWGQYDAAWLALGDDPARAPGVPSHAPAGRDLRPLGATIAGCHDGGDCAHGRKCHSPAIARGFVATRASDTASATVADDAVTETIYASLANPSYCQRSTLRWGMRWSRASPSMPSCSMSRPCSKTSRS